MQPSRTDAEKDLAGRIYGLSPKLGEFIAPPLTLIDDQKDTASAQKGTCSLKWYTASAT